MGDDRYEMELQEYLQNWESLDEEERSYVWKQMDAGLKTYVRDEKEEDDWQRLTYTPGEWNGMEEDEREKVWNSLPSYEQDFLEGTEEYDTAGLTPLTADQEYSSTSSDQSDTVDEAADAASDALYLSGTPGMMAVGSAIDVGRSVDASTVLDMMEDVLRSKGKNYVEKISGDTESST